MKKELYTYLFDGSKLELVEILNTEYYFKNLNDGSIKRMNKSEVELYLIKDK